MLLRVEDLSKLTGLSFINAFMLGGQIICVSKYLDHDWTMYKIDPDTFAVKRFAQIIFYEIDISSWPCINQVVVHDQVAYAWSKENSIMIAGTIEGDEFHWELMQADVPEILRAEDCQIVFGEGTTTTLTMLVNHSLAPCPIICQFDLPTKTWTQFEVNDDSFDGIRGKSRFIWTVNGKVHLIMFNTSEVHMVLDIKTKKWKLVDDLSIGISCKHCIFNTHYILDDKLYKLGTDESKCSIYVFNDNHNKWIKKCEFEIDPTSLISPCTTQVVVSGNRVFLMTYTDQEEWYLSKVYVIDLEPCLLTRALSMIQGDRKIMKLGEDVLPRDVLSLLNRDTTGDALAIREMAEYFAHYAIQPDPTMP